jgi:hypothetical protein
MYRQRKPKRLLRLNKDFQIVIRAMATLSGILPFTDNEGVAADKYYRELTIADKDHHQAPAVKEKMARKKDEIEARRQLAVFMSRH